VADTDNGLHLHQDLDALVLRRPYAVLGFGGWIDAGFAATGAVRYLIDQLDAKLIAELDPETYYSFTDTRPRVQIEGEARVPQWPRAEWFAARTSDEIDHDLLLFVAPEPNLRWRTFTNVMLDLLQRLDTEAVVSLGAVLAPIHHRARVSIRGRATNDALRAQLRKRRLRSGNYQGPTGITTVLLAAAQERGMPGFSLSASSPNYLANIPNPRVSAALLRMLADISGIALPLAEIERDARALVEQVDQSLASQPELREAVERLAEMADFSEPTTPEPPPEPQGPPPELPSSAAVLRELEDFLKDLRQNNGESESSSN
jgi:proteasome assembly chaperone (PAC2) family protein